MRQNESSFIEHRSCPDCQSRDNLAIYTDHEYCFGCGRLVFYNYHNRRIQETKETGEKIVSLPEDIAPYIPSIADTWLKQYELTQNELLVNRVVWSEYRQLLVFPYFGDKNYLYGWQGRYFGANPTHPKWIGHGNFKKTATIWKNSLTNLKDSSIILVEDIVSCIKIQRLYNSSCLFGSSININNYITLYNKYNLKEIIIWLDKDKMKESYQYSLSFNKLGINSRVISTDLDPKYYSTEQLRGIVESKTTNTSSLP